MPDPQCARHPDVQFADRAVVKAGTYAVGDHPRQLFWCYPQGNRAGGDRHRYAGVMARTILLPEDPTFCPDCSNDRQTHEGPIHCQGYGFPARAIAAAMVAVGNGTSYGEAARNARTTAERHSTNSRRAAKFGANGTLVADWVGTHGPILSSQVTKGVSWPETIALDELPFLGSVARRAAAKALGRPKSLIGWGVLGAYGFPLGDPNGCLMALRATPVLDSTAAVKFLLSYPGRPRYVVCDGGKVWPKAVRQAWPDVRDKATGELLKASPRVLPCTWHLGGDLRRWLKTTLVATAADASLATPPPPATSPSFNVGLVNKTTRPASPAHPTPGRVPLDERHPLRKAVSSALKSVRGWDEFFALAQQWQAEELLARLGDGSDVRELLTSWPAGVSRSSGGIEAALRKVKLRLAYRSGALANVERTQQLLNLILMSLRGLADERSYNLILHQALLTTAGRPAPQKVGVTGGPRLQGVSTTRHDDQFPKLGPPVPYKRRAGVRQTPAGLRHAEAHALMLAAEVEDVLVPF